MQQLELIEDTRLSHSSASLLLGCEKKYWHYKVAKDPADPDYDDNQDFFIIGKSFHHILEKTKHRTAKDAGLKVKDLIDECISDHGLDPSDAPLVHAMTLSYIRKFKQEGLEVVDVEFSIESNEVVGYIDALVKDSEGNWWILDLKTAKTVQTGLIAKLPLNRQLNLYAYYYKQFAEKYELDINKFKGCIYAVTTKSSAKQRVTEEYKDYVLRMADLINTVIFYIPKDKMNPSLIFEHHMDLYKRSLELRNGDKPKMNLEYCFNYFKPCQFWQHCHGCTYTEGCDGGI